MRVPADCSESSVKINNSNIKTGLIFRNIYLHAIQLSNNYEKIAIKNEKKSIEAKKLKKSNKILQRFLMFKMFENML